MSYSDESENPLEFLRRQMRESEERLMKAGEKAAAGKPAPFGRSPSGSLKVAGSSIPSQAKTVAAESDAEWNAYGQMTPGFLNEISRFIADNLRAASEAAQHHPDPEITRHLQSIDRLRSLLDRWIASAEFLPSSLPGPNFADMLQNALRARKAEFLRYGIKAEFEDATTIAKSCSCTPLIYQSLLHVVQCCIEQLREGSGGSRLAVRIQNTDERLETSFVCEFSSIPVSTTPAETGSASDEFLRAKNVELRAAQKMLDSMGGTLVLENVSETQRSIRVSLSVSALLAERTPKEKSRT